MKRLILFSLAVLFVMALGVEKAKAIPAFSRKYKTSCATCHIVFPKLTAFGEAFRRNGYQFPGGTDAQFSKEEPVSIGSEGYKKLFPNALWPNAIPGTFPFAVVLESELMYNPNEPGPRTTFEDIGSVVEAFAGGSAGDNISYWGELEFAGEVIEVERAYLVFNNLFGTKLGLNFKLGKFEPGVLSVTNHRRVTPRYWITTKTVGDNQWSLEGTQKGFELYGVLGQGRLGYNLGLVEGRRNNPNSAKDVYAHLAYKFGGLRWDGIVEDTGAMLAKPKPYVDNSVAIGGFIYNGHAGLRNKTDDFQMFGGDVNIFYEGLNLIGGFARQHDDSPFVVSTTSANGINYFAEAQYVVFPWLIPYFRFEGFKQDIEGVSDEKFANRILPGVNILYRANVKFSFSAEWEKEPEPGAKFRAMEGAIGFEVGF